MSTLRPSDNPVDFENKKTTTNAVACRTLLPSMRYHPAYVVRLLNERCLEGDPQTRPIPSEKTHSVVKLALENSLLYSTPTLVSLQKDGETRFAVFFPLPSCCVSSLIVSLRNRTGGRRGRQNTCV